MIQKIALLVGGLGAAAVLAFALGLTNFVFAGPGTSDAASQGANQSADVAAANVAAPAADQNTKQATAGQGQGAQTQKRTVIDKVYIAPTPPPKTIHVGNNTPNNPPAQHTQPSTNTPAQPPAASPNSHATPSYDDGSQESEHSGRSHGHERGDD